MKKKRRISALSLLSLIFVLLWSKNHLWVAVNYDHDNILAY